jgi:hypothetical protein
VSIEQKCVSHIFFRSETDWILSFSHCISRYQQPVWNIKLFTVFNNKIWLSGADSIKKDYNFKNFSNASYKVKKLYNIHKRSRPNQYVGVSNSGCNFRQISPLMNCVAGVIWIIKSLVRVQQGSTLTYNSTFNASAKQSWETYMSNIREPIDSWMGPQAPTLTRKKGRGRKLSNKIVTPRLGCRKRNCHPPDFEKNRLSVKFGCHHE